MGLACGAVHPLGFVLAVAALPVYLAFAAALGTFVSLHAWSTARSVAITVGALIFLNGGYLLCCLPFSPDDLTVLLGSTPFLMYVARVRTATSTTSPPRGDYSIYNRAGEILLAWSLLLPFYGLGGVLLNVFAAIGFDAAVDRQLRRGRSRPESAGEGRRLTRMTEVFAHVPGPLFAVELMTTARRGATTRA